MAETTFTFLDGGETERTALAGANGSGHLAPAALLYDASGAVLVGRKAATASVPVALSTEDNAVLSAIQTLIDALTTPSDTQPISASSLPLPTGAATQATLAQVLSALASVAVTGPLTDSQLRAVPVPVGGAMLANLSAAIDPNGKMGVSIASQFGPLKVEAPAYEYTWFTTTVSASGDTILIAAPGEDYATVVETVVIQNTSTTATVYILKAGSIAALTIRAAGDGDGIAHTFQREWVLDWDTALIINLSGANASVVSVRYRTVE